MDSLDEWGLGGRGFGTVVTWFLLGGDLYTAYTFVAVPAAMYATGAISGFFAVPYTIVVYPLIFVFMPRLWSVAHAKGYVTPADFIRGRYDSRSLSLAVAVTGILATMPYIALQLVGIEAVLDTIGLGSDSNWLVQDMPLFIAFAVLAAFTYSSGLRAPALIAFVKDILIYLVIVVAIIWVAVHIGYGDMFSAAKTKMETVTPAGTPTGVFVPSSGPVGYWAYASLALGSALALFMYPHSITAVLSGRTRNTIRRNAAILPAYSLLLGLLALLGFAAIAAGTSVFGTDGKANAQLAVPHLFQENFPSWFAGIAYSAIAIGALVPSAIMSIAAANLFTRNIYKEFINKHASHADEARASKIMSLVVKFGALLFVLTLDNQNAINFQLLGGVWILQQGSPSWPGSSPGGSTSTPCSPDGRSAWSTGRSCPTSRRCRTSSSPSSTAPRHRQSTANATSAAHGGVPVHRHEGLRRPDRIAAQHHRCGRADLDPAGGEDLVGRRLHHTRRLLRRLRQGTSRSRPVPGR